MYKGKNLIFQGFDALKVFAKVYFNEKIGLFRGQKVLFGLAECIKSV